MSQLDPKSTLQNGEQAPAAPSISLPKGGGAVRGMGEKFAANPVTGTGSLTVPIRTSPGRAGFGPALALSYDSGSGNGPFGFGWQLSIPSITRKTDKGLPRYCDGEESDTFLLSGAEDLVPVLKQGTQGEWVADESERDGYRILRYRPRMEGLFARVERWTRQSDADVHWRSISRDNITTLYGENSASRIADSGDPLRVFSWLISESHDDKGNAILYDYATENSSNIDLASHHERNRTEATRAANRYIKRIKYGNQIPRQTDEDLRERSDWLFEVIFDYDEGHLESVEKLDEWGEQELVRAWRSALAEWPVRSDPFSYYRAGFEVRSYRLCRRVLMFHHFADQLNTDDYLVGLTELSYTQSTIASFITAIMQSGCVRKSDGTFLKKSLPPAEFEYTSAEIQDEVHEIDEESLENLPVGLDGANYEWVDLDGEGISGILNRSDRGWLYHRNYAPVSDKLRAGASAFSACFGATEFVAEVPSIAGGSARKLQFMDLAGDGRPDLVQVGGAVTGYFERTVSGAWDSLTTFESVPAVDWDDPNVKLVDLTGDGHADILVTEDNVFTWYPSLGEAGFDTSARIALPQEEEDGPRLVFADGTDSIYLADLSGDGLTDLVRIRNGEICYWPNLGYGQFGKKVTMDNAPWFDAPDLFNQERVRLADIDGSGTTDILYLRSDRVDVYRNQSGNSWSEVETLAGFPSIDNHSAVQAIDLLGNGTACLVWSSPLSEDAHNPMRYIDLMGGQKPHLLVKVRNNLGAETHVQYAPSTRFYLDDKFAGRPWITRLPFPVHVVERVETYDWISRNRFVTRYAYHHGYFDGPEREFRGFGMVEQWDTEEFAALSASDAFPAGDNVDESSHVPPILTKTWFHTGAYIEGESISQEYAKEYYSEPGRTEEEIQSQLLPDTLLPDGLDAAETRESVRALKGSILRQEIYALDGSDESVHPYSVSERNYSVRLLQPWADNAHAVFHTHPREQLDYQYERDPSDPRVVHSLTLDVDAFGNVLKSASIGYGRRIPDTALAAEDQARQLSTLVTLTENDYTNSIDQEGAYRTPLVAEARTFELTGLIPATDRFEFDAFAAALTEASEIAYEESPDGSVQKRLLSKLRTLYRADDLSGPLALGELESRALPSEGYSLAFTPGLLESVFAGRSVEAALEGEGGYIDLDDDSHWWVRTGGSYFSPDPAASASVELVEAVAHFFQPRRFEDAFGATTTVDYDEYDLFLTKITDPIGNSTLAMSDYRVLQPSLVTDPNGNRVAVAFDAQGLVVGTAVMGKEVENLGDSLDGFEADLDTEAVAAWFASPLSDPHSLLAGATTRLAYDPFAYYRTRVEDSPQPAVVGTIARETHLSDLVSGELPEVQISFSVSDGFGREIQKKVRAEAGPVLAGGVDVSPRWVGSGWAVFNNKGNPVRKYEPFFSATHAFEFARTVGVSPILLYDSLQRVVATIHPNHAWEKVVFDAWRQSTWDANDTVGIVDPGSDPDVGYLFSRLPSEDYLPVWSTPRTTGGLGDDERSASEKALAHADTPTTAYLDTLGRPFLSVADNGAAGKYETRTELDIRSLLLSITDARGNRVMAYTYDLLKRQVHSSSMDAGERWNLPDATGKPIRAWDSRGQTFRTVYDELRRLTHLFVQSAASVEVLVERIVFGEAHSSADTLNLLGKVYQQYDGAGVVTNEAFDFRGNVVRTSRRLALEYKATIDWSLLGELMDAAEIMSAAEMYLEADTFTQSTTHDALNRPISQVLPDSTEIRPTYNEASLLEQVKARLRGATEWTTFVEDLDYNAKGQRELIEYGNGVVTRYEYDEFTFRLRSLSTKRDSDGDLQDLSYSYDPVGNITSLRDAAQQTIFFAGAEVTPDAEYVYDAIYQLIEATGREHIGQSSQVDEKDAPFLTIPHPNDTQAMRRYLEQYEYDETGNILELAHTADMGTWTRYYAYADNSNRLMSTSLPRDDPAGPYTDNYAHDSHGSMSSMPHLSSIAWDYKDRMKLADLGGGGMAYFVYDSAGQRVRKVHEHNGSTVEERIYLGGFELFRKRQAGKLVLQREAVHVLGDKRRIALVETKTYDTAAVGSPSPLTRYQLGNHLDSSCIELDDVGAVVTYEEYLPFGTTAFHSMAGSDEGSTKRYRYTASERDEETGLSYHQVRFYACWLCRWSSADPLNSGNRDNRFTYTLNNPLRYHDKSGAIAVKATERNMVDDVLVGIATDSGTPVVQESTVDFPNERGRMDVGIPRKTPPSPTGTQALTYFEDKLPTNASGVPPLSDFKPGQIANGIPGEPSTLLGTVAGDKNAAILPSGSKIKAEVLIISPANIEKAQAIIELEGSKRSLLKSPVTDAALTDTQATPSTTAKLDAPTSQGTTSLPDAPRSHGMTPTLDTIADALPGPPSASSKLGKLATGIGGVVMEKGGKVIPFVGTAVGGALVANEAAAGNYAGAFVEAAGASEIPIVAQVADIASIAVDIGWVAKEVIDPEQRFERWAYETFYK